MRKHSKPSEEEVKEKRNKVAVLTSDEVEVEFKCKKQTGSPFMKLCYKPLCSNQYCN